MFVQVHSSFVADAAGGVCWPNGPRWLGASLLCPFEELALINGVEATFVGATGEDVDNTHYIGSSKTKAN